VIAVAVALSEAFSEADVDWVLSLSAANEIETGPLDRDKLVQLASESFAARVVRPDVAYLLTFAPDAGIEGPNFSWFKARGGRFIYVDRIVVAEAARGQGVARRLYEDLFVQARAAGYDEVTCEVNRDPPNPISDQFHAALGFVPLGTALLPNGKTVTYLTRTLKEHTQ
jgi:predicted GNAT superfamily acetyltransferase